MAVNTERETKGGGRRIGMGAKPQGAGGGSPPAGPEAELR